MRHDRVAVAQLLLMKEHDRIAVAQAALEHDAAAQAMLLLMEEHGGCVVAQSMLLLMKEHGKVAVAQAALMMQRSQLGPESEVMHWVSDRIPHLHLLSVSPDSHPHWKLLAEGESETRQRWAQKWLEA